MFVNRTRELKFLENVRKQFENNMNVPVAIMGLRRIGKTELIRKFRINESKNESKSNILIPYINLEGTTSSPETFAQDFYLAFLKEILRKQKTDFEASGSKREQIIAISSMIGAKVYSKSMRLISTIDSKDYNELLKVCFSLPEEIAGELNLKVMFFVDEFQEFADLNNYRFGDVFKIMRSVVEKQELVLYVISGSVISFMETVVSDSREPFFNQFRILKLGYFTKEDSIKLVKGLLNINTDTDAKKIDEKTLHEIFKNTLGHPFYITAVCERIVLEFGEDIDVNLVRYAVLKEILDVNGKINLIFKYILEGSLQKAKRKGYIKEILIYLSENEGTTLSEISRYLNKPTGQVSNYLSSLLQTDLIFKSENKYYFRDPVFRFWIAKTQCGKDVGIKRGEKAVEDHISDLEEKYLRASSELGKAKESELKQKIGVGFS
ncbi:MAG: hypothetical protein CVT90_00755 [Candidatus Altiarchaeales archaeon HGW-Altiarchaeales-3]|nr:MAG: hypothetical protein CVT90_00755 [Candidatus Altiarchaeales archaeon HGW-Altiarchaeales-3]